MLDKHLPGLLSTLRDKGFLVEQVFGGSDATIKQLLEIVDSGATAVCASFSYRWISRQLMGGNLAPVFGKDFDLIDRWVLVRKYRQYELELKKPIQQRRQEAVQQLGLQPLEPVEKWVVNKVLIEAPYEAMIDVDEPLMHQLVASGAFAPWASAEVSDANVAKMLAAIELAVQASAAAELQLEIEMTTSGEGFDPNVAWPRGYDHYANQDPDFYGVLSVKSMLFGHAMAIRCEGATGCVHFFDPNVGHYKFLSWSQFLPYLQFYWIVIWMVELEGKNVFPDPSQFLRWYLIQYRKRPLDPDLAMFLWDNSGVSC